MGASQRPTTITTTAAALLVFIFCLLFIQINQVESTGSFEMRLHRFSEAGCCGRSFSVSFRICVTNYQTFVELQTQCIVGETFTRPFTETQLITLSAQSPPIIFPFNFTWPGSFSFVIEAYYETETNDKKMLLSRFIAQRDLSANVDWQHEKLTSTTGPSLDVSYRIKCEPNYYGEDCNNHCSARDDKFGHYTCDAKNGRKICIPGWGNEYCSTAICRPGCNKLHGHCEQPFECRCRPGWEGELCDICSRYPGCEHGTCLNAWQCNCNEGWGGLFCNQDLNYCTNHKPCKNGGTCTNTGQGSYTCSCSKGFMGKDCDLLINPCDRNPCRNSGTCVNSSEGNYTCSCNLGFYGPKCETSANICTFNPCLNGGSCVHASDGYVCDCISGFIGQHCEEPVSSCTHHFCHNNGSCMDINGSPHCNCSAGFHGVHCEERILCKNQPCGHGGRCMQESNSHWCSCYPGFTGVFCDVKLHNCSPNPCHNGGKCHYAGPTYRCDCKPDFTGENCSVIKDTCALSPCHNGGTCKSDLGSYSCICIYPYHGLLCEYSRVPLFETTNISKTISNISHQVSDNPKAKDGNMVLILVCSLLSMAAFITLFICAIIICCKMRRKHHAKQVNEAEDEVQQSKRNDLQMNNKCILSQSNIVNNTLDKMTAKINNEDLEKVPHVQFNNRILPEKNILQVQRTLERRNKSLSSGNSHCSNPHIWPSDNNRGGVFVIQDHIQKDEDWYQSRPPSLLLIDSDKVLATDV